MSKPDGGPAFPNGSYDTKTGNNLGMTLRDWFAGMALQGICANPDISKTAAKEGLWV